MPRIHNILKTTLLSGAVALSLFASAHAQTTAADALSGEDKVVATVNGYEIKTS